MLPVMVCAEGFLLSHTSELLDIPDQGENRRLPVAAGILPVEWLLDPARPHTFSGLPEPTDYAAFQKKCRRGARRGSRRHRDHCRRVQRPEFGRTRRWAHSSGRKPAWKRR